MRRLLFIFCLYFISSLALAQSADSLRVLDWEVYQEWIRQYHPVARQAALQPEFGLNSLRAARGNFDPLLYGNWMEKDFDNKQYYNQRNAGISLPTTLGVEFNAQYELNTGLFLNPERNVPSDGLLSAGVAVNLGQGLLIDQHRAALRQARIFRDASLNEQRAMLNRLYLDAAVAYWNWFKSYLDVSTINDGLSLAQIRFGAVKGAFQQGELPAIDTVEAYSQVQTRKYQYLEMQRRFFEQTQVLSAFLWDDSERLILLSENIIPGELPQLEVDANTTADLFLQLSQHPDLQAVEYKLADLEVNRRLKAEYLKPKVSVKYNFLNAGTSLNTPEMPVFSNDYQWGVNFAYPLLIRSARGELNMTKIKIKETQFEQDLKSAQIENRLRAEINSYFLLERQLGTYGNNINALERILQGERQRFQVGESSLFLVNARENSLIEAQMIINDLLSRQQIAFTRIRWAAGLGFVD